MTTLALDFFNQPIIQGSYIAYPVRQGSNMWHEVAKVTGVKFGEEIKLRVVKRNGQKTSIKNISKCIVAPEDWVQTEGF